MEFDIKIVQFEMNEWLSASGHLSGYCEIVDFHHYLDAEVRKAEKGLMLISEWPDSKFEAIMAESGEETEIVSQNV